MKNTTTESTRRALILRESAHTMMDTADAETIETLLYTLTPGRDCSDKARALIETFGSFRAVMDADTAALAKIAGQATADKIHLVRNLARKYITADQEEPERITNRHALEAYCRQLLAGETKEKFYVIAVNAQCQLLGARMISVGTLSEVSAYPRSVVETALNLNAHSVFFTHNHPGGTCAPSAEDIASTIQIQRLLNGIGILVLDHVIVAGQSCYSMSQQGDMDFRTRAR